MTTPLPEQLLTARERRSFAKARLDNAARAALAGDLDAERLATDALCEFNAADAALKALAQLQERRHEAE